MKIKYSIIFVTLIFLMGCTRDNYLDFQPIGRIIPTTVEDYRLLLDQVEGGNGPSSGFYNSHYLSITMSDDMDVTDEQLINLTTSNYARNIYTFQDHIYLPTQEDEEWKFYYAQIYQANIVIDGLNSVTNGTQEQIDELMGEAKLHRAFAYFNLVNLYSVHYNAATANTDLGVPIRTGTALEGVDLTRASVQATYDYIINDITTSVNALPDVQAQSVRYRPSKAAALALLAKVYLYQGRFNEALTEINDALALYSTLRDMNDDLDVNDQVNGDIDIPLGNQNNEVVWFKTPVFFVDDNPPILRNDLISQLYETDDLRRRAFAGLDLLIFNTSVSGLDEKSYYARFDKSKPTGINSSDLWLIKAECEARVGSAAMAIDALNTLRQNRYLASTYTPVDITDATALLTFVKAERRRENMGQPTRVFDIKRYNRFDNDNITVTHELNGTTYTLAPNSLNWALPIARKYIQLNPEIEQNPRD